MKIKGIDHKWLLAVLIVMTAALVAVYIYQTRDMRYAKKIYFKNDDALAQAVEDYKGIAIGGSVYTTDVLLTDPDGEDMTCYMRAESNDKGDARVLITIKEKSLGDLKAERWYLVYEDEGCKDGLKGAKGWSGYGRINDSWSVWRYRGETG